MVFIIYEFPLSHAVIIYFWRFFFFFFVDHIIFFWLDLVDIPPNAQNLAGLLTFFWRFLSFVSISPPPLVDLRDGW